MGPSWASAGLSEEELRSLELSENVQREDLDSFELSKQRMREIEETLADSAIVTGKRGPKPSPKSDSSLAKSSGVSRTTVRETRRHVETAEEFPAMQGNGWTRAS